MTQITTLDTNQQHFTQEQIVTCSGRLVLFVKSNDYHY